MAHLFCGSCGNKDSFIHDTENGELVCKRCGLVVSEGPIFEYKPVDKFNNQTGRFETAQHGAYGTGMIHDYGMSTKVGKFLGTSKMTQEQRNQFYRLRQWQTRSCTRESRDRNLVIALSFLVAMCDELAIPRSVKEYAAKIYRLAFDSRIVRGRSICHVAAASLYFACRVHGVIRSLKDIASTNVLKPEAEKFDKFEIVIARVYRVMHQKLNLKPPNASPLPFVAKICSQMGLPSTVEQAAAKLLQEYTAKKFSAGKSPQGLAATAIYIACRQLGVKNVTQVALAKAAQVSDVTVRNRYKEMVEKLKIDVLHQKNTWKVQESPPAPDSKTSKLW